MAFTEAEYQDIRYYLGRSANGDYPTYGIDAVRDALTPEEESRARGLLGALRTLETKLMESVTCGNLLSVDGATFNPTAHQKMIRNLGRQKCRVLAEWLGVTMECFATPFDGDSMFTRTQRGG